MKKESCIFSIFTYRKQSSSKFSSVKRVPNNVWYYLLWFFTAIKYVSQRWVYLSSGFWSHNWSRELNISTAKQTNVERDDKITFFPPAVVEASTYHVEIKSTAPAVIGARINFTAELYQDGKIAPRRQYNFRWSDSAFPKHTQVSRLLSYVY